VISGAATYTVSLTHPTEKSSPKAKSAIHLFFILVLFLIQLNIANTSRLTYLVKTPSISLLLAVYIPKVEPLLSPRPDLLKIPMILRETNVTLNP
jgi:hypothetical protein